METFDAFFWCQLEYTVEQTAHLPVIEDTVVLRWWMNLQRETIHQKTEQTLPQMFPIP